MTRSTRLFRQAEKLLVGGVNSPVRAFRAVGGHPVFMAKGRGAEMTAADGRRYIDYLGSWGPLLLGHAPASVVRAAEKTLRRGSTFGAPTEAEVRLAALVQKAFPSMERMRFVSSGTEACMSALRLARGATGRPLIVKFAGCYHGHSDGLLVAAGSGATTFGHPTSAGVPREMARLTLVLPFNDEAAVQRAFRTHGRSIAAVILEPVVGNMGVVPGSVRFLSALRALTRKNGSVLIFDEVITGFRLARGGAQEYLGVRPDLTCLGKIVGGGFPVGAFGGARRLMENLSPLGPVYQAGTLSGNPVAMAAGAALLEEIQRRPPYARLRAMTEELVRGLHALARKHGHAVTINAVESMFTVFFTASPVTDYASAMKSDAKRYARFFHGLLRRGVYFPPAQFEAAFVSAAHTERHIERTLAAASESFREL
jgi:glutamate-1-semialdehyde 2,1-aminomutase